MSVIARQADGEAQPSPVEISDRIGDQNVNAPTGIVKDAVTYSSWGFILVGLSSLALPEIGPSLAAGSLGAALVATVAGTELAAWSANHLVKVLTDHVIPDAQARVYSDIGLDQLVDQY